MYGGVGQVGIIGGGGRRGMSDIAWHPDNVSCIHCALAESSCIPHTSLGYKTCDIARG